METGKEQDLDKEMRKHFDVFLSQSMSRHEITWNAYIASVSLHKWERIQYKNARAKYIILEYIKYVSIKLTKQKDLNTY